MNILAAAGPIIETEVFDGVKQFVNNWSPPQYSLPLFAVLFVLMLGFYRQWTRPVLGTVLLSTFCVVYFGAMFVDANYFEILRKPDNVPITMMLLGVWLCLWIAFRQASHNDALLAAGKPLVEQEKDDKVLVWPDLVYTEMICLIVATAILVAWGVALPAPLEAPANPAGPPNPSKAPWYFLGLQEMLVYFDPWMAGVLLPGLIVTGLIAMPYIDTNPKGNGYYTLRERPFAISVWLFGFLILWVVLIVFGTFLRGPNWNFFGPFTPWDSHMQVPLTNVNLAQYFWLWWLDSPEPTRDTSMWGPFYMICREAPGIVGTAVFVLGGMALLGRVLMRNLRAQMGFLRFYIMAVHLIIMAMLPLKMVLRWTCTLKYFIYLPEFNLNL